MRPIQRALISVSDKTGVVELAHELDRLGITILSTGGTAKALRESGVPVTEVSSYTGFPEIMGGRVKTLHPRIHGGLLGRRGEDDAVMAEHGIEPIDLLVVNLYPFERTVTEGDAGYDEAIKQMDIGGPAMIRAGAKNHAAVTVLVDPADYPVIVDELKAGGVQISDETRAKLAAKAFAHTGSYDAVIAQYLGRVTSKNTSAMADTQLLRLQKLHDLRYGENPHQKAAFYADAFVDEVSLVNAEQLQGKELSFNNIADADAALECVRQFYEPACVIVKHANPCGVAVDERILTAYQRAYATDPTSAFGGIIAFNRELDEETAQTIIDRQFVEVIVAPAIGRAARSVLDQKSNIRVLETGAWDIERKMALDIKRVTGGMLVQDRDDGLVKPEDLKVVTKRAPTEHEIRDLLFAWKVTKFVKSNAIVFAKDQMTIGIGAGQMSRVYSARIAAIKAVDGGLAVKGSVMASDAFFPFRDSIERAAQNGIVAVIQPGGSIRDGDVIAAANESNIAMVFTGMRHFRH